MTFPHLAISAAIRLRVSSGVLARASIPIYIQRDNSKSSSARRGGTGTLWGDWGPAPSQPGIIIIHSKITFQ